MSEENKPTNITLELLIRTGDEEKVKEFLESHKFDEAEHLTKTQIYSIIKAIEFDIESGYIETERTQEFNEKHVANYLSTTKDINLLNHLLDVLKEGTIAEVSEGGQLGAMEILAFESVTKAIRNNLDNKTISGKMHAIVDRAYELVFSDHLDGAKVFEDWFSDVDIWRDIYGQCGSFFVEEVMEGFSGKGEIFGYEDKKELHIDEEHFYAVLDKLIELTDRTTVSEAVYNEFKDHTEFYVKLVADGKIDAYITNEEETNKEAEREILKSNTSFNEAVLKYERKTSPSGYDVESLAEVFSEGRKDSLTGKLYEWFVEGKVEHVLAIANYEDGRLLNIESARDSMSKAISEASDKGKLDKLDIALKLPEYLIDKTNPEIKDFVEAYNISKS